MFRKRLIPLVGLLAALSFASFQAAAALSSVAIRGDRIFTYPILKAAGGVILQASATFVDSKGKPIPVTKLTLGREGTRSCVYYEEKCYGIPAGQDVVAPLANWVSRRQTVAFSMVVYSDEPEAAELVKSILQAVKTVDVKDACSKEGFPCFVAREFRGTSMEQWLHHLDFTDSYDLSPDEDRILKRLNHDRGVKECDYLSVEGGSYVNTDVDSKFVVRLESGAARISGTLLRYHWFQCPGSSLPYVHTVHRLDETAPPGEPMHSKATNFAQVAAVLRAFEDRKAELSKLAPVN